MTQAELATHSDYFPPSTRAPRKVTCRFVSPFNLSGCSLVAGQRGVTSTPAVGKSATSLFFPEAQAYYIMCNLIRTSISEKYDENILHA